MRRRSASQNAKRSRRPRLRGHAPSRIKQHAPVATPDEHACRIAQLRIAKRRLTLRLDAINLRLDAALIAARRDRVPHAIVGHTVQRAEGRPETEADLLQLEAELRKLTHYAMRRLSDPARIEAQLDDSRRLHETSDMNNPAMPYRRRTEVVEEWWAPAPQPGDEAADLDDVEDLNREEQLDRDLGDADDDDLDDEDDFDEDE